MSHTTSQRFVNASVNPSFNASAINFSLLLLMVMFLINSSLSLFASSALILFSLMVFHRYRFLPEPLLGAITISREGALEYQGKKHLIQCASFNTAFIGVILTCADNRRLMLWRDSVTDDEYRRLLVQLRSLSSMHEAEM
ncbi:protein YgfX [uncultured Vibrio sp.]|uniref:protein YgfX n=1 Tax=uncultured Vibrio sp. TaxID=114054 RepID=UPI000912B55B|nr:protein YgfX [uncultured Vibrio sp.]OIQ24314.1 MAG: hypothetical protein BM561_10300 [Vibrio sp. MedPE-SWchi]